MLTAEKTRRDLPLCGPPDTSRNRRERAPEYRCLTGRFDRWMDRSPVEPPFESDVARAGSYTQDGNLGMKAYWAKRKKKKTTKKSGK